MASSFGDYVICFYLCEIVFPDETRKSINFDPLRVFGGVYGTFGDVSVLDRRLERLEAIGCLNFDRILSYYVGF